MRRRTTLCIALLTLVGLAACGEPEKEIGMPWPSEASRRMQPDHAPTPFTADQIREGCPVGRRSTFRVEMPGRTPFLQTFHFVAADAEGAEVRFTLRDEAGKLLGEPTTSKSAWDGFQAHASYAAAGTTITETEETVPAGSYAGFHYRVVGEGTVTEAFFAKDLPGPPVRLVRTRDGVAELTMTLVAHEIE